MGLKITGGNFRGKKLDILSIKAFRYTSSKVRESIFNMLKDVSGYKILELFAGSGIFSLEALSRGAHWATLVEKDERMVSLIKKNFENLSLKEKCEVLRMDAYKAIPFLYKKGVKYDIIFLDPPYEMGYVNGTLMRLKQNPLYTEDSIIILEHSKREIPNTGGQEGTITKRYGDTCVTMIFVKGAN